nr:mannan endo-1,4-beta-mannosidase 7-like [Coffea arabica]
MKKHFGPFFLIFLFLIHNRRTSSEVSAQDEFIRTEGVQFLEEGSPFYANGFNAYWLMIFGSDPSKQNKVSTAFEEAVSHGLTVARTWAFNDGGDFPLQFSPGNYNEKMFQGLDLVISEARKYGIRLILSLVNNYDNYGGKKQYVDWARSKGENLNSDDDFFTNAVVKGYYKDHIKAVLTRQNSITGVFYKDDPIIMAWELMNEPRCTTDASGKTIQAWISEMGSYLKSIDRNHLLGAGLEGFYGPSNAQKQHLNPNFQAGTDFIASNQIKDIDFATVHSYPDAWLAGQSEEAQLSFLINWLQSHIQDAEKILQKPLLFTEFGKSSKDPGFNMNQRDLLFNTVYSTIYSSASGGGAAAGGLFWQFLT